MNRGNRPGQTGPDAPGTPKPWEHAKQGRGSATDPLATRFVASLKYDHRLYKQDIAGSMAHARMLRRAGLIDDGELVEIERGLSQIQDEIAAAQLGAPIANGWSGWNEGLEDVHMCIEAALIEKTGDAGRKLHTGRSRNDQVALDMKLWIHEAVDNLDRDFDALFRSLVDLAQRDGRIVMPGYTHLQRAQPIVVGGELMAWLTAFDRARQRIVALHTINRGNPLGSGAVAGSGLPLDRLHTAAALPLGPPTPSSIDATASRDVAIDFVYALSMTSMTLSRWADQWIIYATNEFGFLALDGRYTTGSSMMPQKCNPDMLELIRGRCGSVYGHLVALLTICKGIGIGYFRDLQQDKRHVFEAYDDVSDCLEMATRIVATSRFDESRIKETLDRGFLDATSLAEYLVTKGVPFRRAHQIVGALVGGCQARGMVSLSQLALVDLNAACLAGGAEGNPCGEDVYDWLGPQRVVQRYRTIGNAGVDGFNQQLEAWQKRLDGAKDPP